MNHPLFVLISKSEPPSVRIFAVWSVPARNEFCVLHNAGGFRPFVYAAKADVPVEEHGSPIVSRDPRLLHFQPSLPPDLGLFFFKLLTQPARKCRELFVAAQEVAHHLAPRLGAALLQYGLPVPSPRVASQQICGIKLPEEIERNHLIECIRVVVRRVPRQVAEAAVHPVAVDPFPRLEPLVEFLDTPVEVDRLW